MLPPEYLCSLWMAALLLTHVLRCPQWSNGYAWPGDPEDHVDEQGVPHPDTSMWECLLAPDERFGKWYKEPVKYPTTNRRTMWYGNGTFESDGKYSAGTWEDGARPG